MSNNPYAPLSNSILRKNNTKVSPEDTEVEDTTLPEEEPQEDNVDLVEISNGTIKEVTEWVGEDKDRAEQMMTLEIGKGPKARTTLVNALSEILS